MTEGSENMFKGMAMIFDSLCKESSEVNTLEEPITSEPVSSDDVIALARKKMEKNKALQETIGKMVAEMGVQSISVMTPEQLKTLKTRIEQLW